VVIITARGNEHWAAEAIKRGAADYIAASGGYLDKLCLGVVAAAGKRTTAGAAGRETAFYRRILNALPVHIALVDDRGTHGAVNDAWRQSAFDTHYQRGGYAEGTNYLAICDSAVEQHLEEASAIAQGLRRVLAGQCATFAAEYPWQCGQERRCFKIAAS